MNSTGVGRRQEKNEWQRVGELPRLMFGNQYDFQGGMGKLWAADGHTTIDEQGEEGRGIGE